MNEPKKYPMLMQSVLKSYLWGGSRLCEEYGKATALDPVAESWELSCHRDGLSVIANGEYAGMTLADYVALDPASVLGSDCDADGGFPILVKLIDAKKPLSVQVHPQDDYAREYENDNGKAEMWFVLQAQEGASLVYGVNRALDKEEFRRLIDENRLDEVLCRINVRPGDAIFVPPGTIHAIGGGILIAEVQQSSNATYRVWDYGRLGTDGKPRTLHVEKSIDVAKLTPTPVPPVPKGEDVFPGGRQTVLARCDRFTVRRLKLDGELTAATEPRSFEGITCVEGSCRLAWSGGELTLKKGSTVFIPAASPTFTLTGRAELIRAGR